MSMPDALPMKITLIAPPIQPTTLILATPITITLSRSILLHCDSFLKQTVYQTLSNRSLATTLSVASHSLIQTRNPIIANFLMFYQLS
jgi:hypothetical protein